MREASEVQQARARTDGGVKHGASNCSSCASSAA
jgi:hypothetical protein